MVAGNLLINVGATLDTRSGSNHQLNVGGNWTNQGAFTERLGLVVFDGAAAQLISATTSRNFF